jgi:hypothetical protein
MPWKSDQQRKWGHSKAGKEALGGEAAVHEWDKATKGKDLPRKVEKSMASPMKMGIKTVKTPRAKTMPGAFDKPSAFFKSEMSPPKHPSARKLWDFLSNRRAGK